jgi:hypothetical protein
VAYGWTVFAPLSSLVVAVFSVLATAMFLVGALLDRLSDGMDQLFERVDPLSERVDQRFDGVEARMREDKAELLGRMDVLAERITRLETG